jgi:cell division septation protein DedD
METISSSEISAARAKLAARIAALDSEPVPAPAATPTPTKSAEPTPEDFLQQIAALPKQQILEGLRELARKNLWPEFGVVLHCLPKGTRVLINVELIS